ncbi:exodeoxyribonuclease VII small subunit [Bacterioplanes sanyensis]|uniref:Exodeoxyribonuclease 7 small subunit n=1 Tax=Bacterioplanes sanyensis TaxID=1249553 RepID=A0A222FI16_9GAMM|nr:exodeoxyribonuclease VII small subunit [Bacterioplanes sanyensis]ASP38410.1 exodeoxyribonuclease VII small subunit [Bacterioplanes sanyensis]
MSDSAQEFEFEPALEQLEQLVNQMESGQLTLEQSLQAFEQGVALTRRCQQTLAQAEQRVRLLVEQNGASQEQPFQMDGEQ